MKHYSHIFFDLDRTLWDFDRNSLETFKEIYNYHKLKDKGILSFEQFIMIYTHHNQRLWDLYRLGQISKEELSVKRFSLTLEHFGVGEKGLAEIISKDYIHLSPLKTQLLPNTHEILSYLKPHYTLHIITNGFEEIQSKKLKNSHLEHYFQCIITSERAGSKKPDSGIFIYALNQVGAKKEECLMIGDDLEVDIIGARQSGIDQVFINFDRIGHKEKVTYEIFELIELKSIL